MSLFLAGVMPRSAHARFYKTAGYCLDDCFPSCENIIWISFKGMYGIYYLSHNKLNFV